MGFINQSNCLISDSIGNIYIFSWSEQGINLSTYLKTTGQAYNKILVENIIDEYDVTIDDQDIIYLICQKNDGTVLLLSYENDIWNESVLAEAFDSRLYNLSIVSIKDKLHIIYCVSSNEKSNKLKVFHHYLCNDKWFTFEVEEIVRKEIINSFQIICNNHEIMLGYYDLVGNFEELFIKRFSTSENQWTDPIQLTSKQTTKLYIDLLMIDDDCIDLTYCEYENCNLIIKYEKHKLLLNDSTKICESILSNPGNCMYPTLIYSQGILWDIWTEYDNIVSCFSDDNGLSWSLPHLWKESKNNEFLRYKFISNDNHINSVHVLNNSYGSIANEVTFIGFGNVENAVELPLKSKKKEGTIEQLGTCNRGQKKVFIEKGDAEMENELLNLRENIESLEIHVKKLEKYIKDINEIQNNEDNSNIFEDVKKIKSIEKRLDEIEAYIFRRRRSGPFGSRE